MKPKHDYVVKYTSANPVYKESRGMTVAATVFIVVLCLLSSCNF